MLQCIAGAGRGRTQNIAPVGETSLASVVWICFVLHYHPIYAFQFIPLCTFDIPVILTVRLVLHYYFAFYLSLHRPVHTHSRLRIIYIFSGVLSQVGTALICERSISKRQVCQKNQVCISGYARSSRNDVFTITLNPLAIQTSGQTFSSRHISHISLFHIIDQY